MSTRDQIVSAFTAALADYGVKPSDTSRIEIDGAWHRLHIDGDRGRTENLSYRIFNDDRPAGFFEDHKRGFSGTFSVRNGADRAPVTDAQRAEWEAVKRRREVEQAVAYAEAAERAAKFLMKCKADPAAHPYLQRKRLDPTPDVHATGDGLLIIPVYSDFNKLASYQSISADGEKLFMPGGKMAGAFHPIIGTDKRRVLVCEGWATGAVLRRATGHSVACAMSAGNLPAVVAAMRAKFPGREIVAAVDSDRWQTCAMCEAPVFIPKAPEYCSSCGKKHRKHDAGARSGAESKARVFTPVFADDDRRTDWADFAELHSDAAIADTLEQPEPAGPEPDPVPAPTEPAAAPDEPAAGDLPTHEAEPVDETPAPPASKAYSTMVRWSDLGLELSDRGVPHPNLDNATRILERHPAMLGAFWFDEFLGRVLTTWDSPNEPREWSDSDDVRLALWMQRAISIGKMAVGTARDAVTAAAMQNRRNECTEWLRAQRWDGVRRLHQFIAIGFGAEQNAYTEAVGRCWLVSMVARALNPGCKVDTMPVFEGAQGARKSSGLEALVGKRWFAEAAESVMSKDFFQTLQGKLLVEIAEMDTFSRAEVAAVKRVITCKVDRYRAPYGRRAEDHPRMCVFSGTTNEDEYLRDATGARRFWPVRCGDVDTEWLTKWRGQLFAEAVKLYDAGTPWWDVPVDDARREQEQRRVSDEWEALFEHWLIGKFEVTIGEVLGDCLKIDADAWDKATQMRASAVLKALNWNRVTARRGDKVLKVWRHPKGGNGGNELPL